VVELSATLFNPQGIQDTHNELILSAFICFDIIQNYLIIEHSLNNIPLASIQNKTFIFMQSHRAGKVAKIL